MIGAFASLNLNEIPTATTHRTLLTAENTMTAGATSAMEVPHRRIQYAMCTGTAEGNRDIATMSPANTNTSKPPDAKTRTRASVNVETHSTTKLISTRMFGASLCARSREATVSNRPKLTAQ